MHMYPFSQALTARSGNGYHLMLHSPLISFSSCSCARSACSPRRKKNVVYLSILRIVSSDGERGARRCILHPYFRSPA